MDDIKRERVVEVEQVQSLEEALLETARHDPNAFAGLYDLYAQRVYRYLLSKTGNRQEAEDLTAQTFLAALQGFAKYRHRGNFAAWLFTIARNKTSDHYRRQHRQVSLDEIGGGGSGDWRMEGVSWERALDLSNLIAGYPEEEQELLRLRFVAQMRFREIAALLGRNEGAVKKKVYRLLARLESQLEGYDG
jgi:RNA polymerase sigma-70 factor (ECF subfamily)